jgi:hypothetical protein
MEYLMTYGWAILIISIVLAALFQLGVFNPMAFAPKAQPGSCQVFRPNGPGTTSFINLEGECTGELPEYAAQFNGQNGYIAVGTVLPLSPSQITVCAWINPTVITGSRREIVGNDNTASDSFFLSLNNNGNSEGDFWVHTTGGWFGPVVTPSAVPLNTWSFLCGNWTGTSEYIYLNGKSVGGPITTSSTISLPMGLPMTIGDDNGGQWWYGSISNIQIYNTSLSASDIQALYLEGIGGAPIDLQNLVAWWPLNGNANDYSGNDNNGQINNVNFVSNWYSSYTPT